MVVSVAATGPGTDAEPVSSTLFASRYVRGPLPRSVPAFGSGSSVSSPPRPLVGQERHHGFHY